MSRCIESCIWESKHLSHRRKSMKWPFYTNLTGVNLVLFRKPDIAAQCINRIYEKINRNSVIKFTPATIEPIKWMNVGKPLIINLSVSIESGVKGHRFITRWWINSLNTRITLFFWTLRVATHSTIRQIAKKKKFLITDRKEAKKIIKDHKNHSREEKWPLRIINHVLGPEQFTFL